jgi:sugar-specific transcriptional regulator TrmB
LCKRLLPQDYRHKSAEIRRYQLFFQQQSSDAVFQMVEVINVSEREIVLAVPSPVLVNYLRLHMNQIQQQIQEQFGQSPAIKVVAMPDSNIKADADIQRKGVKHFSNDVSERMQKSVTAIDDDKLREAMQALARAIRKPDD